MFKSIGADLQTDNGLMKSLKQYFNKGSVSQG